MSQLPQYLHNTDEWETPKNIFWFASVRWGPYLMDVAANSSNTKVEDNYSGDGLNIKWSFNNWCNPPFSLMSEFVDKIVYEQSLGNQTTLICKAAIETKWFETIRRNANEVVFLSPRVHYIGAGKSASFPSCFCRFDSGPKGIVSWYNFKTGEYY